MATQKFIGFYLYLRDRRESLDLLMRQFYVQLLGALKLYGSLSVRIAGQKILLTEELMVDDAAAFAQKSQMVENLVLSNHDDFLLINGAYIIAFRDGAVLFRILRIILEGIGDSTAPLEAKRQQYASEGRTFTQLRAFYWYIDTNFVSQLPSEYQVTFTVDCLLYSEWSITHPNLVGMHMLVLTWMLGVNHFKQFIPPGMQTCSQVTRPLFQHFLPTMGIQIHYGDYTKQQTSEDSNVTATNVKNA